MQQTVGVNAKCPCRLDHGLRREHGVRIGRPNTLERRGKLGDTLRHQLNISHIERRLCQLAFLLTASMVQGRKDPTLAFSGGQVTFLHTTSGGRDATERKGVGRRQKVVARRRLHEAGQGSLCLQELRTLGVQESLPDALKSVHHAQVT